MRAAEFIRELRQFETNGELPELDHSLPPQRPHRRRSLPSIPPRARKSPTTTSPWAASSRRSRHSRFWPETCLFAIEDDPQAGWDHVSGYRTTCYVVSPYTKRRQTISTQYNHSAWCAPLS